jgi:hypothetical protein
MLKYSEESIQLHTIKKWNGNRMTKDEVVDMMLFSINTDNRALCKQSGMSEEDIETQVAQSQQSLMLIVGNMYDMLKEAEVIS